MAIAKKKYRDILASLGVTVTLSAAFLVLMKPSLTQTFEFLRIPLAYSQSTCDALVFVICLIFACIYARIVGLDLCGGFATVMVGAVGASTVFNQGDVSLWVKDWVPCLAVVLIVSAMSKTRGIELLRAFFFASTFYLLCNLVYILQVYGGFPFDATDSLFYSYRTASWRIVFPSFICSLLLDNASGKRISIRSLTIYLVGLAELMVGYTATCLFSFVFLGVAVVLVQWRALRRVLNGVTYAIGYLISFLGIVVLRMQEHFSFVIEGFLHRNLTFTGRTALWDASMQLLANSHFFTGYGASYVWGTIVINEIAFKHSHNEFLHVMMAGGVIALLALLALAALAVVRLYQSRVVLTDAILAAGLGSLFLVGLVEELTHPAFFFLLALAICGRCAAGQKRNVALTRDVMAPCD